MDEEDRYEQAFNNLRTQNEQSMQAFHHMSDRLSHARQQNRALADHIAELVSENSRLRLALANAQNGDF
jgi:hypothetical protein